MDLWLYICFVINLFKYEPAEQGFPSLLSVPPKVSSFQSFSTAAVAFGTIFCKAALEQYVLWKPQNKEIKLYLNI